MEFSFVSWSAVLRSGVSSRGVSSRGVSSRGVSCSIVLSHEVEFSLVSRSLVFDRGVGCHLAESRLSSWSLVSRSPVSNRGVEFSSVQLKTASMRSEKPICAPPRLSEVSSTSPLKRSQWSREWQKTQAPYSYQSHAQVSIQRYCYPPNTNSALPT